MSAVLKSKQETRQGVAANDFVVADLSLADWGGVSSRRMNEFVTVDALYVLKAAGRI